MSAYRDNAKEEDPPEWSPFSRMGYILIERRFMGKKDKYGDRPRGWFIVKGEPLVEIAPCSEDNVHLGPGTEIAIKYDSNRQIGKNLHTVLVEDIIAYKI